eukprot:m.220810 g.220810  ORF g.220810 m.220810 type:complete len:93 (-) comp15652_c0_seq1:138-416(-)
MAWRSFLGISMAAAVFFFSPNSLPSTTMSGRFPYACPYCQRPNTVSAPGNSCGRAGCNVGRSVNKNIVQPLVRGAADGLSKGVGGVHFGGRK